LGRFFFGCRYLTRHFLLPNRFLLLNGRQFFGIHVDMPTPRRVPLLTRWLAILLHGRRAFQTPLHDGAFPTAFTPPHAFLGSTLKESAPCCLR
jgi:hypothetical protein